MAVTRQTGVKTSAELAGKIARFNPEPCSVATVGDAGQTAPSLAQQLTAVQFKPGPAASLSTLLSSDADAGPLLLAVTLYLGVEKVEPVVTTLFF